MWYQDKISEQLPTLAENKEILQFQQKQKRKISIVLEFCMIKMFFIPVCGIHLLYYAKY